jgi:multidrug efflux pump subunit AcrB
VHARFIIPGIGALALVAGIAGWREQVAQGTQAQVAPPRVPVVAQKVRVSDVDLGELNKWGPIVETAVAKLPQLADVTSDQQSSAPQLTLAINRDAASRLGITASQIDSVPYDAFGQRPIAQLCTA